MNTLKNTLNYEKITTFVFDKEDFVSERIISFYQEYLFGNIYKPNTQSVKKIDEIIGEFVRKGKFYQFVEEKLIELENSNAGLDYYQNLDKNLKALYKEYNSVVHVNTTKWL